MIFFYLKNIEKATTKQSTGTIMQNVNQETLKRISIAIPPKHQSAIINQFNDVINPLFEKINLLSNQNQELSKLRDWLLPMLMNGQVTVGKAYEQVAEALSMAAEE
jgi:type I restriction enzyme S subunit